MYAIGLLLGVPLFLGLAFALLTELKLWIRDKLKV